MSPFLNIDVNPFYVNSVSANTCMVTKRCILFTNTYNIRQGKTIVQHLNSFNLTLEQIVEMLSYLWLHLILINKIEAANIVQMEKRKLETNKRVGFGDIRIDNWITISKNN